MRVSSLDFGPRVSSDSICIKPWTHLIQTLDKESKEPVLKFGVATWLKSGKNSSKLEPMGLIDSNLTTDLRWKPI